MGSEPGAGWTFLQGALNSTPAGTPIVILCNRRSAARIDEAQLHPDVEVRVIGWHGEERLPHQLERVYYLWWIVAARRTLARRSCSSDVVHHVTYASEVLPPALPRRWAGKRVWGPVGSGTDARVFLVGPRSARAVWEYGRQRGRELVSAGLFRHHVRRADVVLFQSQAAQMRLGRDRAKAFILPNYVQRGIKVDHPAEVAGGLHLLCVGQLVALKRVDLAIRVLAEPALLDAHLTIAGSGPRAVGLRRLAHRLGVHRRISWLGEVERGRVAHLMASSDVLVHLSSREGASGVVAEATIAALPVVCFSGTGAESTLRYAGGAGIAMSLMPLPTVADVAGAVREAASLKMPPSRAWREDRLVQTLARVYAPGPNAN